MSNDIYGHSDLIILIEIGHKATRHRGLGSVGQKAKLEQNISWKIRVNPFHVGTIFNSYREGVIRIQ